MKRTFVPFLLLALSLLWSASVVGMVSSLDPEGSFFVGGDEIGPGKAFTLRTVISFPNKEGTSELQALWLAGIATEENGEPAVLSLSVSKQGGGWWSMWGLQLSSSLREVAMAVEMNEDGDGPLQGAKYRSLLDVWPEEGSVYESIISYEPVTGVVAVSVNEVQSEKRLFAAEFEVELPKETLYPVSGILGEEGHRAIIDQIQVFNRFVPVNVSWNLLEDNEDLPGLFGGRSYHLRMLSSSGAATGRFDLIRNDDQNGVTVASFHAVTKDDEIIVPFKVDGIAPGPISLELWYKDEQGYQWSLGKSTWKYFSGELAARVGKVERVGEVVRGHLVLHGTGSLNAQIVRLQATVSTLGKPDEETFQLAVPDFEFSSASSHVTIPFEFPIRTKEQTVSVVFAIGATQGVNVSFPSAKHQLVPKMQNEGYVDPVIVDLFVNESLTRTFGGTKARRIKLISVQDEIEPYFSNNKWHDIVARAAVEVEVDGVRATIYAGQYQMPVDINGLNVLVNLTKGLSGGASPVRMPKDVRLEVKDASLRWVEKGRFAFPLEGYRWRAGTYNHTWNSVVHVEPNGLVYYHRGEDFSTVSNVQNVLSIASGVISTLPPRQGDGAGNTIVVEGHSLRFSYLHSNAHTVNRLLEQSIVIPRATVLSKAGDYWHGTVKGPHLHLGIADKESGIRVNSYPIVALAYLEQYPDEIIPVAGGKRFSKVGDSLTLDAHLSIIPIGVTVQSYQWNFCDGTSATGPEVTKVYAEKGTFSEELVITDTLGRTFRSYVIVHVSAMEGSEPPRAMISYYPQRGITTNTDIWFSANHYGVSDLKVDFGNGEQADYSTSFIYRYSEEGDYVVTLIGYSPSGGRVFYKVNVKVGN